MILIDFSQVFISNLYMQLGKHLNADLNEDLIRHMVLNSIRMYVQKFSSDYGEMIICCDSRKSWRRSFFQYYKANRRKSREESEIDWTMVFKSLDKIQHELEEFFPYRVVYVESAEADDVIGTIVENNGVILNREGSEKILILSADRDFIQLQRYANVEQYDPIRKRWINHNDPEQYLYEHILKGDPGDGVPNVLSSDDTFVVGSRQKPMTAKRMEKAIESIKNGVVPDDIAQGFYRNKQLVDLTQTPTQIKDAIINKYQEQSGKGRSHLFNYFIKHKLKNLTECINEF